MSDLSPDALKPRDEREELMVANAYNLGIVRGEKAAQERISALQAQLDEVRSVHWPYTTAEASGL